MKSLPILALSAALGAPIAASSHGSGEPPAARKFDPARVEPTAFGQEGDPAKVVRTIRVVMSDNMRFAPAALSVRRGETVRLTIVNKGKVLHELVLGTPEDLASHAELMKKFPGMEHDAPNMAHVKPGTAGEIVWQFTQSGRFEFACLIPGHFEAGMVGTVTVR
jgi:uncharacterized cupredoxin-like copper-binding protein